MASVRFICGTHDLHRELEQRDRATISARTTRSCSPPASTPMAALFETAARRGRRDHLRRAQPRLDHRRRAAVQGQALPLRHHRHGRPRDAAEAGRRRRRALPLIATDGVFSMDGYVAKLPEICALAEKYGALVMVDDCHATGHLGAAGQGHAGAHRRRRSRRHRHRHLRQDARRRHGRLRRRRAADHRPAAPARPALSVLQRLAPAGRRRLAEGHRDRRGAPTTARTKLMGHATRFRDGDERAPASSCCPARRRSSR